MIFIIILGVLATIEAFVIVYLVARDDWSYDGELMNQLFSTMIELGKSNKCITNQNDKIRGLREDIVDKDQTIKWLSEELEQWKRGQQISFRGYDEEQLLKLIQQDRSNKGQSADYWRNEYYTLKSESDNDKLVLGEIKNLVEAEDSPNSPL